MPDVDPALLPSTEVPQGTLQDAITGALSPQPATPPGTPAPVQIKRDPPDIDPSRKAYLNRVIENVKRGRKHHKKAFKKMRDDMKFAKGIQYKNQSEEDERYLVNFVQRHVNQRVSALYARNPTFVAKRRERLDFVLWDGTATALQQAHDALAAINPTPLPTMPGAPPMPAPPPNPAAQQDAMNAEALLADVQQGVVKRRLFDRIGKTLEILFKYSLEEPSPNVKESMKQLVRRVETCGVGYVKLDYQRLMDKRPDWASQINDVSVRLQTIERLMADQADQVTNEASAEAEELRVALAALQAEPQVIVREGLLFHFPKPTRIIIDRNCEQIKGFVGANWIAEEFLMSVDDIKEVYNVDVKASFKEYTVEGTEITGVGRVDSNTGPDIGSKIACVIQYYDKKTGLKLCLCEGYGDFLCEPAAPEITVPQFWPFYAITFNDIEDEKDLFPPSDVRLLRTIQTEYNRTGESRRQHRIANRPLYVAPPGVLEDEDAKNLTKYDAHDVIEVTGLKEGQKAEEIIQPLKKVPIDPNLYDTHAILEDKNLVVGSSDASTGTPQGKTTATGDSIAADAQVSSLSSNADDMDELLSALARDGSRVLLTEMSQEAVVAIVGPGAVWPKLSPEEVAEDVYLDVKAGSSGRPNKAQMMANLQRIAPFLMQTPGLNPEWFIRYSLTAMDDGVDLTDAVIAGLPSISAMSGMGHQPEPGNPMTDPTLQGGEGAANSPAPPSGPAGTPALHPAPHEATPAP